MEASGSQSSTCLLLGLLLDEQRVDWGPADARELQRGGNVEALVNAILGAVAGELLEPQCFMESDAAIAQQDPM